MREWIVRFCVYLIGLIILSFSISLTIKAGLGAGAWDALNVGLSKTIGLTVGVWVFIIGFFLILLNAWLMRMKPMFFAVFTIVLLGSFIDFWLLQVFHDWKPEEFVVRIGVFLFAILFLGFGVAVYLQADFPINPIDNLMVAISERFGVTFMTAKTIGEISALILAFIFGGPVGIGTVVITFLIGPIIHLFEPKVKPVIHRLRFAN
ncbi:membrane protein [Bacillus tianshenii]|nr:membrane protein [Bacillus tianshenii]